MFILFHFLQVDIGEGDDKFIHVMYNKIYPMTAPIQVPPTFQHVSLYYNKDDPLLGRF